MWEAADRTSRRRHLLAVCMVIALASTPSLAADADQGKPPTTRCSPEHVNVANPSQAPTEAARSGAAPAIETSRTTAPAAIAALPPSPPRPGVLPDKDLIGGSVRTRDRDAACGHARESRGQMPPRHVCRQLQGKVAKVPELTRSAGVNLNARVSLRAAS
jgi:hypothetical protein